MSGSLPGFEIVAATKYQDALQHPAKVFKDPKLSRGRVEMRGAIPKYRSGGFAVVYRVSSRDNDQHKEEVMAVRCFKRLAPDLAERYRCISDHLNRVAAKSPFLVTTRYLSEGIRVEGEWKPITTMTWIDGDFLDVFLDSAATQPHLMAWLEAKVRALAEDLQRNEIAHGDLHHKNILVSPLMSGDHALRLIDYDGMFVPTLSRKRASELGQANYQHPDRSETDFNERLDAFSLLVLYLNVVAVKRHPELWDPQTRLTDGLLTSAEDYRDPDSSAILLRMASYPDMRGLVQAFRRSCLGPFQDVMSPRDFFDLARAEPVAVELVPQNSPPPSNPPVRSAPAQPRIIGTARRELRALAGELATVVGQYESFAKGSGKAGSPYRTLFCMATGGASFEVIAERPIADQFRATGRPWKVKPGDWLRIDGLLLNDGDRFVIDLDQAADLSRIEPIDAARLLRRQLPEAGRRTPGGGSSAPPAASVSLRDLLGIRD